MTLNTASPILGSPPHTWRIPQFAWNGKIYDRITSTYVENTLPICRRVKALQDHLHIRGEYKDTEKKFLKVLGSPPHTWRILYQYAEGLKHYRITSTYVENTKTPKRNSWRYWDHLHIRGEYNILKMLHNQCRGSPPHTWRIHSRIISNRP